MTQGRKLVGVEADRVRIKSAASRIIRTILNQPKSTWDTIHTRKDWLAPPKLSSFSDLEPLGFGLHQDDWWIFHPEDCTPDVVWPLNVGFITDENPEFSMVINNIRTVTPKQARGYCSRIAPKMVRRDVAQHIDGGMVSASFLQVWVGGKWVDANSGRKWENDIPQSGRAMTENEMGGVNLGIGLALRQRYEWAISLSSEGSPSIRFATDPNGIKDILRIRDLPANKDRRDALLTWVTDHWRADRYDPDVEGYVRKHLRGATSFDWWGMKGKIIPAQFDVEQRDAMIADREAMRVAGLDKRKKAIVA